MDESCISVFRETLYSISKQLTDKDVKDMKYLCSDYLTAVQKKSITDACDLFDILEQRGTISEDNFTFLINIMKNLQREDLRKQLIDMRAGPNNNSGTSQLQIHHHTMKGTLTDFKKCLKINVGPNNNSGTSQLQIHQHTMKGTLAYPQTNTVPYQGGGGVAGPTQMSPGHFPLADQHKQSSSSGNLRAPAYFNQHTPQTGLGSTYFNKENVSFDSGSLCEDQESGSCSSEVASEERLKAIKRAKDQEALQRNMHNLEQIAIHCKECSAFICQASELRRKGVAGHVTCISQDFKSKVIENTYSRPQCFRDSETTGLIKCATYDCKKPLGTMQNFLRLNPPLGYALRAESFKIVFARDGGVKTPKQWKKAGFEIPKEEET